MPLTKEGRPRREINLRGQDGNAFAIIGMTLSVIKQFIKAGILPAGEAEEFSKRAMSGDYQNVLAVCREYVDWVDVSEDDEDDDEEENEYGDGDAEE
jgi:hypothetical protein